MSHRTRTAPGGGEVGTEKSGFKTQKKRTMVTVCDLHKMCWHFYHWADKVEVLEPEAWRAMVTDYR